MINAFFILPMAQICLQRHFSAATGGSIRAQLSEQYCTGIGWHLASPEFPFLTLDLEISRKMPLLSVKESSTASRMKKWTISTSLKATAHTISSMWKSKVVIAEEFRQKHSKAAHMPTVSFRRRGIWTFS